MRINQPTHIRFYGILGSIHTRAIWARYGWLGPFDPVEIEKFGRLR